MFGSYDPPKGKLPSAASAEPPGKPVWDLVAQRRAVDYLAAGKHP